MAAREDDKQTGVSWIVPEGPGAAFSINETATCHVCGAPASGFKDYNSRPKALSGKCGAAKRQRVLAKVYREFIRCE
jgi:hypothetical protein